MGETNTESRRKVHTVARRTLSTDAQLQCVCVREMAELHRVVLRGRRQEREAGVPVQAVHAVAVALQSALLPRQAPVPNSHRLVVAARREAVVHLRPRTHM